MVLKWQSLLHVQVLCIGPFSITAMFLTLGCSLQAIRGDALLLAVICPVCPCGNCGQRQRCRPTRRILSKRCFGKSCRSMNRFKSARAWISAQSAGKQKAYNQLFYGLVTWEKKEMTIKEVVESVNQEWSLKTSQGLAMWSAKQAHCRYRCEVKAGGTPIFTSFLTTWLRILSEWLPFFQGDCKSQWHKFLHSVDRLKETGVQPSRGEVLPATGLGSWWQLHTTPFSQSPYSCNESIHQARRGFLC